MTCADRSPSLSRRPRYFRGVLMSFLAINAIFLFGCARLDWLPTKSFRRIPWSEREIERMREQD
jgi:hypothetical protein